MRQILKNFWRLSTMTNKGHLINDSLKKKICVIITIAVLAMLLLPTAALAAISTTPDAGNNVTESHGRNGTYQNQDDELQQPKLLYQNGDAEVWLYHTNEGSGNGQGNIITVVASGFDGELNDDIVFPLRLTFGYYADDENNNPRYSSTITVLGNGSVVIRETQGNVNPINVPATIIVPPATTEEETTEPEEETTEAETTEPEEETTEAETTEPEEETTEPETTESEEETTEPETTEAPTQPATEPETTITRERRTRDLPTPSQAPVVIVPAEVDAYEEVVDIDFDEEIALAEMPEEHFFDEDTPTTMMPQTGVEDARGLWIFGLCASILGFGIVSVITTKANKKKD